MQKKRKKTSLPERILSSSFKGPLWLDIRTHVPARGMKCYVTNVKAGFLCWVAAYNEEIHTFISWPIGTLSIRDEVRIPLEVTHWYPLPDDIALEDRRSLSKTLLSRLRELGIIKDACGWGKKYALSSFAMTARASTEGCLELACAFMIMASATCA